MVAFDVQNSAALEGAGNIISNVRRGGADLFTVIAVGTKCDPDAPRAISKERAEQFFAKMRPPVPYVETSAQNDIGVHEAFETAINLFLKKLRDPKSAQSSQKCIIA